MRGLVTVVIVAALLVPAAALAQSRTPGDGTLHVNSAEGRVHFLRSFSGVVLGRITVGTLEVVNPDSDCDSLKVWDADDTNERPLPGSRDGVRCIFRSTDRSTPMRFRLVREGDEVRVSGSGIWLSSVGQGRVFVQGSERRVRDGTFAINGDRRPGTLPDRGLTVTIGART
jgi:hypothetical protein